MPDGQVVEEVVVLSFSQRGISNGGLQRTSQVLIHYTVYTPLLPVFDPLPDLSPFILVLSIHRTFRRAVYDVPCVELESLLEVLLLKEGCPLPRRPETNAS